MLVIESCCRLCAPRLAQESAKDKFGDLPDNEMLEKILVTYADFAAQLMFAHHIVTASLDILLARKVCSAFDCWIPFVHAA